MKTYHFYFASLLLVVSAALALYPEPDFITQWNRIAPKFEPLLQQRSVFIDPAELMHLMEDRAVQLMLFDVRPDADYNIFHLKNAKRLSEEGILSTEWSKLAANSIIVLMCNDEIQTIDVWKKLKIRHAANAYILEGGLNAWLDRFAYLDEGKIVRNNDPSRHGRLEFAFSKAIGQRYKASNPGINSIADVKFTKKVNLQKPIRKGGGCG